MSGAIMDYPDLNNLLDDSDDAYDDGDNYDYDEDEDDLQDDWDDMPSSAKARQAAEALRQSKTIYDPLHPAKATATGDDDDETEADGIALGVIPDHEARRWRERRMRLARYIQFVDGPAIGDDDVPAPLAAWLDLGFADPPPVTAPVVRGGQGRASCMGSFVAARPAPGGGDLRKRRGWVGAGAGAGAGEFCFVLFLPVPLIWLKKSSTSQGKPRKWQRLT